MIHLLVLFLLFTCSSVAPQNTFGTEFYTAFWINNFSGGPANIYLTFHAIWQTAIVNVTCPGIKFAESIQVPSNEVSFLIIPTSANIVESGVVLDLGVYITSTKPISVTAYTLLESGSYSSWLVYPSETLGTTYYALGYTGVPFIENTGSVVGILATEDNTTVVFNPSHPVRNQNGSNPIIVTLNRLQVIAFTVPSFAQSIEDWDLSGSFITSNRPIVVAAGAQCAQVPPGVLFCDAVYEQMPPLETWGKDFVIIPFATRSAGDQLRILASVNNTIIKINDVYNETLPQGKFLEITVNQPLEIHCSKPCLVAQYSKGSNADLAAADPEMIIVPPVQQWSNFFTVSIPDCSPWSDFDAGFWFDVAIVSGEECGLMLNNKILNFSNFARMNTRSFSVFSLPLSLGSFNLTHTNSSVRFSARIYGYNGTPNCMVGHLAGGILMQPINGCPLLCNSLVTFCNNTETGFQCGPCPQGYVGNGIGPNGCLYDYCSTYPMVCDPLAYCTNIPGGYRCICAPGYEGDGFLGGSGCSDINECTLNPSPCSPIASCVNWIGGFNCTCPPGYGGNGIGPNGCVDINECLSSPCDPLANCTNTNGSFICTCPIGYNGTGIGPNSCKFSPPQVQPVRPIVVVPANRPQISISVSSFSSSTLSRAISLSPNPFTFMIVMLLHCCYFASHKELRVIRNHR